MKLFYMILYFLVCLIDLLKKDKFKGIKNIKVWTDSRNHFRLYEFIYYLFKEVPNFFKEE